MAGERSQVLPSKCPRDLLQQANAIASQEDLKANHVYDIGNNRSQNQGNPNYEKRRCLCFGSISVVVHLRWVARGAG